MGLSSEDARKFARRDADAIVQVARQRSLTGRVFRADQLRDLAPPSQYRDSPELPARRLVSYWDLWLRGRFPASQPTVLTLYGHARKAWDADGEAPWLAYQDALLEALKEEDVMLIETCSVEYPREGEYADIHSLYATDLRRYQVAVAVPRAGGDGMVSERHVQFALVPSNGGRLRRWWRKRKLRRKLKTSLRVG